MDPVAPAAAPVQLVMDYRTQKIADLPLFNGDKTDAIKPEDFVRKTDAAKDAMRWDDATTAVHFKACFRGTALTWLKTQEFKAINTNSWEVLKPIFSEQFVTPFKEVATLTALANLALKPDEHPRDFDARICQIFIDIKKARPQFVANIPVNPAERTVEFINNQINAALDHDMMHIIKCIFISGLPTEMREKVIDRKPANLQDANRCANEIYENMKTRGSKQTKIEAVNDFVTNDQIPQEYKDDEEIKQAIMAIQRKREGYFKNQNQNRGTNYNSNYNGNRSYGQNTASQSQNNQNNRNNGNQKYCIYCKKPGHIQETCYIRKNKFHALVDKNGRPMKTPGTPEFNLWKSELIAKGKKVMIIEDNSSEPSSIQTLHLN